MWSYHNFQHKETFEIAKVAKPQNLEEFITNTQNYQALVTQIAAEAYRRQMYQPVGAIFQFMFVEPAANAFALQAVKKERFIRTMIDTHFDFLFGRSLRYRTDERELYKRLWDTVHEEGFKIKGLLRALVTSPEYLK